MNGTQTPATNGSDGPINFEATLKEGLIHHQNGRLDEAETSYNQILAREPNQSIVLCMVGLIAQSRNQPDRAIELLQRSIDANPEFADAHCNLGCVLNALGRFEEALVCFDAANSKKAGYVDAFTNKSVALQKLGRVDAAIECLLSAQDLVPQAPQIALNLAELYHAKGQRREALDQCNTSLSLKPDQVSALDLKGVLTQATGRTEEAIELFRAAIQLDEGISSLHNNLGNCLLILERYDEALPSFDRAIALRPDNGSARSNRGVLLRLIGNYEGAEQELRRAIEIDRNNAEAHQNLSFTLMNLNRIDEALGEYDWRWQTPNYAFPMRTYNRPIWDGVTDLSEKTILLWPEQGPGDIVIWASAVPELLSRAKHCIINVYPKLVPLFTRSFPDAEIRPDTGPYNATQSDFDFHLPLGDLFKCLKISPTDHQPRFLEPDPDRVAFWRARLEAVGPAPYVGISWKGALITDARAPNYTKVDDWKDLMKTSATFVNLQCGEREAELHEFQDRFNVAVHDFEDLDLYDNLDDVAAFCSAIDVTISVSTAVAPIAAGVGTETWLLAWKQSPWNNFLLKARGPEVQPFERATGSSWRALFDEMYKRLASTAKPN